MKLLIILTVSSLLVVSSIQEALGQSAMRIVVNSNQRPRPENSKLDDTVTLRDAIAIINGTVSIEQLSQSQKNQVQIINDDGKIPTNRIEFNLPADQTTIALQEILPPLTKPGLIIDGTTQPGYDANQSPTAEISIPKPIVSITPAAGTEIFRGLTVLADDVTVRGLSLYGFTSFHRDTASTPPADIFIAHRAFGDLPEIENNPPPKNVVIENNWLGIPPNETIPVITSAFGVSVFNALNTTIRHNRISYHDGSGVITSIQARGMQVSENIILGNGIAGMPDGIRLEGKIDQSEITSNLICANDGSGIFLFKPEGATKISQNTIKSNGRRFRRAAVYLMGNNHQVINNQISYQSGAGVVITSYPESVGNVIQGDRFFRLEGLSIDLNTRYNVDIQDFQNGDLPIYHEIPPTAD